MKQPSNILYALFYSLQLLFTIPSLYYFHAALSYWESYSNLNKDLYLEIA